MTAASLLKEYARYNVWANKTYIDWLAGKLPELLEAEVPSSFPSIRKTLLHIWGAEKVWLHRLQQIPFDKLPFDTFQGDRDALFEGVLNNSIAFRDYVLEQQDAFFELSSAYSTLVGNASYNTLNAEMILHCMQHSMYHRGQICTMARSLGETDPPAIDYIVYTRKR